MATRGSFHLFVQRSAILAFLLCYFMNNQITMLRSEAIHLLKHVLEAKTAIDNANRAIYEVKDYDEVAVQLISIRAELDTMISYFETQHRIGLKQK